MKDFQRETLCHDPIHGYIPFISYVEQGEVSERTILDHPWVQRMRQIHQLQTAWWVYPTAEHTRFQHIVGAMHMASRTMSSLYDSLKDVCGETVPSRGYVECLMRMTALLHDVGHGPFGHFFDEHFLKEYDLTHESLGAHIVCTELGDLLENVRRCPNSQLLAEEKLDPKQIAFLMQRPGRQENLDSIPRWLVMLRSLFCGLYTVDNMDFVLRDAFMSGYSNRSYDLDRLLRYSYFSKHGLTIHKRGVNALVRFIQARSELFRAVYHHRTVRSIDKTLEGLFKDGKKLLFDGNPLENLNAYLHFTEWSLLVDVARWPQSEDAEKRALGIRWTKILQRQIDWVAIAERNLVFDNPQSENNSIFSDPEIIEKKLRALLPEKMKGLAIWVDLPRHLLRPATGSTQNYLSEPATGAIRPLTDDQLIKQLPSSHRICRIYLDKSATKEQHSIVASALTTLLGGVGEDDLTNM